MNCGISSVWISDSRKYINLKMVEGRGNKRGTRNFTNEIESRTFRLKDESNYHLSLWRVFLLWGKEYLDWAEGDAACCQLGSEVNCKELILLSWP